MRRRLDVELVRRGLVPSRTRAVEAIDAGRVLVGGAPASTPGPPGRRGRGDRAARRRGPRVRVAGRSQARGRARRVRDRRRAAGTRSTSARRPAGFTDCLLQRGAAHVYAVDVGRVAARVVVAPGRAGDGDGAHERPRSRAGRARSACPISASPTSRSSRCARSRRTSLALTADDADFVLLVKPQYEAGRARRRPARHRARSRGARARCCAKSSPASTTPASASRAVIPSPLRGADGNVEFLVARPARAGDGRRPAALDDAVASAHDAAAGAS